MPLGIKANIFWLGKHNMTPKSKYHLKIGTEKVEVTIKEIVKVINSSNLENTKKNYIACNEVAECILELSRPIAFDTVDKNADTSRFVIVDGYEISGGGIILEALTETIKQSDNSNKNIVWHKTKVTYENRCKVLNQKGMVIWFTGMSASGKSTTANEVEMYLNQNGYATYLLDGDNVRHGINSDLGFSEDDRNENIRRIIHIANLFKDAGIVTLVSCITPFEEMRKMAREIIGKENIIQVYVKADLETCLKRDPKGLYKKNITNFTGITSPYEVPQNPDITIDTVKYNEEECAKQVIQEFLKREKK